MISTNIDSFGRKHTYIRISLTNRCNLSCSYCQPSMEHMISPSDFEKQTLPDSILNSNEIIKFLTIMSEFGIRKVRFTGGEPLLRRDICEIIERTKKINGIEKICLTTNGTLLKRKAFALKNAGLDSINISLDSLDKQRFERITGNHAFYDVIDGIYLCITYGLKLKINIVVLDDFTMKEIDTFIKFAVDNSINVRFIEKMPLCRTNFSHNKCIPLDKIERHIVRTHGFVLNAMDGVARTYKLNDTSIGFISPISHPFCSDCNRLRLSSNGLLYRCLFDTEAFDIKPFLDNGSEKELFKYISQFLSHKKKSHSLNKINEKFSVYNSMRFIGG